MSGQLSFIDETEFFDAMPAKKTQHEEKSDVLSRILKILITVLTVFLVGEVLYYICIIPAASVPLVSITGLEHAVREDVYTYSGSLLDSSWLDIDTVELCNAISKCPRFESVNVTKIFPDKLSIAVKERKPAAVALIQQQGRTVPFQIAGDGVIFATGFDDIPEHCVILSGIDFSKVELGSRLHPSLRTLTSDIVALQNSYPELIAAISEIKVESKPYGGYEFVLYPANNSTRMRAKGRLNVDELKYMILVQDVISEFDISTDELDFRAGTVAYRPNGGFHE